MRICFTGRRGLGGVTMRGVQVAKMLGVPFLDLKREFLATRERWDTVVLVKYHDGQGAEIRSRADRLIYDPLDCWSSLQEWKNLDAQRFWKWTRSQLGYDDILATTPACLQVMKNALVSVPVHLLPHHADTLIGVTGRWYDPAGPIVYAGGLRYLGTQIDNLQRAAKKVGRRIILDQDRCCEKRLRGAALALSLRLEPENTSLNKSCKPTIKGANAAAGGVPLLATPDPAHVTGHPGACFVNENISWADNLARGLAWAAETDVCRLENHADRLRAIIHAGKGLL
jgi:hypothetical protein